MSRQALTPQTDQFAQHLLRLGQPWNGDPVRVNEGGERIELERPVALNRPNHTPRETAREVSGEHADSP